MVPLPNDQVELVEPGTCIYLHDERILSLSFESDEKETVSLNEKVLIVEPAPAITSIPVPVISLTSVNEEYVGLERRKGGGGGGKGGSKGGSGGGSGTSNSSMSSS